MPTDVSRSHDGEGQRSDKQYKPSSSSQRTFDLLRINADRNYANSVQSGENIGKREYNKNTERPVNENGKFVEEFKLPDKSGLKGGTYLGMVEFKDKKDYIQQLKRSIARCMGRVTKSKGENGITGEDVRNIFSHHENFREMIDNDNLNGLRAHMELWRQTGNTAQKEYVYYFDRHTAPKFGLS